MTGALELRPAGPADGAALWDILRPAFRAGDSYAVDRDISQSAALRYWTEGEKTAYLAVRSDQEIGRAHV